MFGILFGWRKASKCKKLIRHVQCRLKLLKNKRCSIVRQLRDDVAQLLKYGHNQSAFDRVEQLFMDESIVAVYDLLDHFCEFIIIHLSYIRKHKDCPNDINEAVSTLIFASARCGDLPELRVIRKLFEERYGQRFAMVALELLPGNLVNCQIKENLSIKSVADDVKYRLVDEISRSCLLLEPLAIEYYSELQPEQMKKNKGDQVLRSDVQTNCNGNKESQVQAFNTMEAERKIVHVDLCSDGKKLLIEPCHPHQGPESVGTFTHSSTVPISTPNSMECSMHEKEEGRQGNYTQLNSPFQSRIPESSDKKDVGMATDSSSESPSQLPKEMIYLDDIEEFKSPTSKDESCQDQRLFLFKSSVILTTDKLEDGFNESCQENKESWNDKEDSRSSRKSRKAYGKRQRRTLVSQESLSVKDVESTIYYGESCANSQNDNHKSHHRRKNQKKIPIDERQKSYCAQTRPCCISSNRGMVHECSLEQPCYFCISDDKDDQENQKSRITTLEGLPVHNLKEEKLEHSICHCRCFCTGDTKVELELLHQKPRKDYQIGSMMGDNLTYPEHLPNDPTKKLGKAEEFDYPQSYASSMCSCSRVISQIQPPYLRALTMPPERPSDCHAENILRSNSFPFQQPNFLSNGSPTCRHVHPKLPDYDRLAATFMALKKANLQHQKA